MTAPRPDRDALRRAAEAVLAKDWPTVSDALDCMEMYRATANPAVVLALLDEADAADARLAAVEALCAEARVLVIKGQAGDFPVRAVLAAHLQDALGIEPKRDTPESLRAALNLLSPAEEADDRRDQDDYDAREGRL